MTLIVGILCTDGIVMAADGAATLGVMGTYTAQQKAVRKLEICHGRIIIGVSGHVGLGQRFRALIEDGYTNNKWKGRPEIAVGAMRQSLWETAKLEWESANMVGSALRNQAVLQSAITNMLVAIPLDGKLSLAQFDEKCAPELATKDLPFVAIGSGQPLADPFLAFARRLLWPTDLPSIKLGILTAVWTLQHAIETNTGGIAEPIQVIKLERVGKEFRAAELAEAELAEHREAVSDLEASIKKWRAQFTDAPETPAPASPPQ